MRNLFGICGLVVWTVLPVNGGQPITLRVTPLQSFAPAPVRVTARIEPSAANRALTIVADGSDQIQQGYRANVVVRSTFDGDRLIVTHTRTKKTDQGEKTMSRQSVWTLSPDGRVLTIDTTMHSERGDRAMKTVYQRS